MQELRVYDLLNTQLLRIPVAYFACSWYNKFRGDESDPERAS